MLLLLNINQNDKIWDVNFRLIRVKKKLSTKVQINTEYEWRHHKTFDLCV